MHLYCYVVELIEHLSLTLILGSIICWFALQETSLFENLHQKFQKKCKINTTDLRVKDHSHR